MRVGTFVWKTGWLSPTIHAPHASSKCAKQLSDAASSAAMLATTKPKRQTAPPPPPSAPATSSKRPGDFPNPIPKRGCGDIFCAYLGGMMRIGVCVFFSQTLFFSLPPPLRFYNPTHRNTRGGGLGRGGLGRGGAGRGGLGREPGPRTGKGQGVRFANWKQG